MHATTDHPTPTYIDRLVGVLASAPGRVLIKRDNAETRAGELLAAIYRHARALDARGIGRGDLVAIFAINDARALVLRYAANLVGAGATFMTAPAAAEARAALIEALQPRLLVVFPETAALLPPGIAVPLAGLGTAPAGGFDLLEAAADLPGTPFDCRARPEDLAIVVSSGGSTGIPKGSWRTFATYSRMVTVPSPPERRQLVNGPLAYLSQVLVDMSLLGGGSVVFRDRFEAADTAATIEAERITDLFLVEPQLFEWMDHPALDGADLSSLRTLTHIGASAPPTLRRRARERFGPHIVHTYGASEEGLVSLLPPSPGDPATADCRSAGHVLPGVELRFRRSDGSLASTGETGSIEVHSPGMAQGYRNRPDLEALVFRDGWYRSGDLGRLDEDGLLQIFGRAVDIEFIDARMVTPTQIEETLCRLPAVRYAVVVVEADFSRRFAIVLPWAGRDVDVEACRAAIAAEQGDRVARSVLLLPRDSVPLTAQGKPDREAIRALGHAAAAAP